MRIYLRTANTSLSDWLATGMLKNESWRCIHTKFPIQTKDEAQVLPLLYAMLKSSFEDIIEGMIFIFADGNVLFIFEGRAQPIITKFEDLATTMFDTTNITTTVLDLGIEWTKFETLAESILTTYRVPTQNTKTESLTKLDSEFLLKIRQIRDKRLRPLVLLFEDDNFTKGILTTLLQIECDVVTASTISHGLSLYQQKLPNIVFMDIELPDGRGIDATKRITEADPEAYVIMLSGHTMQENILECLDVGARGFIAKPFTKDRVMHYVKTYKEGFIPVDGTRKFHQGEGIEIKHGFTKTSIADGELHQ